MKSPDEEYLSIVKNILENGREKTDRTGTGTIALVGQTMRFDLQKGFPLLTTKKVFWKGVVEELLWMISGSTDASKLSQKGVKIWDANGSREFLDRNGFLEREVNDLGPIYGFQWRHFGACYKTKNDDYSGQGVDQLAEAIRLLKTDPYSRRIIVNSWNVSDIKNASLPPCHVMYQFVVDDNDHNNKEEKNKKRVSCVMTQRSGDMGLGIPFNIAFYSLLTLMVAQVCDMVPGELVITVGDAHIYKDHVGPLTEQLTREPFGSPTVILDPSIKDIDAFQSGHIVLEGYQHHSLIAMKMAV